MADDEKRARRNARADERAREAKYEPAIQLITGELAELVELRGRIAYARTLAARAGRTDIVAALDGSPIPARGCSECGGHVPPGSCCPSCGLINHEEE